MPGFPDGMRRILFDPENQFEDSTDPARNYIRSASWAAIAADLARD
jgi:hypothetical protein